MPADSVSAPPPASLPPGTVIDRYVIVSTVGRGGMGVVYAAYDPQLERRIAVKILHTELVSPDTRARFLREAQALARLSHPSVVTVHDVGTFHESVFLAMEYIEGDSLTKWLKAQPRTCPEVVAVLAQAGRGIQAAHVAGIVHRDVKPDNFLIAKDGRVVVMDFGLARNDLRPDLPSEGLLSLSARLPSQIPESEEPVTLEGHVLGTIGYMSPEQACEEPIDARTDQWSFCATLYFAIYGQRPIPERRVDDYVVAVDKAVIHPPAKKGVPSRVRRALQRGLARRPDDRFPSMEALLRELQPDTARQPWLVAGALTMVAAAGTASLLALRRPPDRGPACPDPSPALHDAWGSAQRDELRQVFEASGAPNADATAGRVDAVLDQYAQRWVETSQQACEATRVRHVAGEETMQAGLACLERRRTELTSLVQVLAHADKQVVARSVEAAYGLLAPSACDGHARAAVDALPADPALRARIVDARRALADAESLVAAGEVREARARAEEALAAARATKHRATEAEALMELGDTDERSGVYEAALDPYAHAIAAAEAASDDATVAEAAARLAFISGDKLLRPRDATEWIDIAYAALDRLGPNDAVRAKILLAHAPLPVAAGHPEDSIPLFDQLIPLAERLYGEETPKTARALNNLGYAQQMLGRPALALETHRRAVAIVERTVGPDTPAAANHVANVGSSLLGLGRYDEAREALERAIRIAALGDPQSFWVGWAAQYLGLVELRTGDLAGALGATTRGLAVAAYQGAPAARLLAGLLTVRGGALLAKGDADGALDACTQAVKALEERGVPTADKVLEWDPYTCVGEALTARGKAAGAIPILERTAALPRRVYAGDLAVARFALARALVAAHKDVPRAMELAQQASKELADLDARSRDRDALQKWLAANTPPPGK